MIEMKNKPINNKKTGPTLTSEDVALQLGESSVWVLTLSRRDPEKFKNGRYLEGWVRKPGSTPIGPDEWLASDFVSSRDPAIKNMNLMGIAARVYFYQETIDAYLARFPKPAAADEEKIDEQLIERVQEIAQPEFEELGYVTRGRVKAEYKNLYPDEYRWRTDIGAVLDRLGYPMKKHRASSKKRKGPS